MATAGAMELMMARKPHIALSDACTAHSQRPPCADHHRGASSSEEQHQQQLQQDRFPPLFLGPLTQCMDLW